MEVGVFYLIEIWYTRAMKIDDTIKKAIILGATGGIGGQLAKELAATFGASDFSESRC